MAFALQRDIAFTQHHAVFFHCRVVFKKKNISLCRLFPFKFCFAISLLLLQDLISLVNNYDNLCNPSNPSVAITPHEALSQMFAQHKSQFHLPTLTLFVRMMGIYPPGSVVQLTDERFALVVSVNSARPIKPRVVIYDPLIPREEALVICLDAEPELGIRRSLKPLQLPKSAYDYLSPRKRLCYFFERGRESISSESDA